MILTVYDHSINKTLHINTNNISYVDYHFIDDINNAKATIYFIGDTPTLSLFQDRAVEFFNHMKKYI